ncbi:MAG: hypothetical protein ACQGVC_12630, partial [Myxococcota bacterium]
VDASGRGRVLAKTLGLQEPEPELCNAAAWGRYEQVADVDDLPPRSFRERIRYASRRLSTIHFAYPGYWIWFIPLRGGITSVGVVCDRKAFPEELRTQEGLTDFVCRHRAAGSLLAEAKPVDHGCYMNLAYRTKQFFDGRARWGLTGEAGAFTDPLYSPGSDFIALENDFLTDLIERDHAGASDEVASRGDLYDAFMLFRTEATMALYRGQYSLLGSYELCKLKWDFDIGSYYNLWVDAYMRDRHLDAAWLESQLAQRPFVLRTIENFRRLYQKVETQLRASGDYHRANLGGYSDGRDCLGFLHDVGTPHDDAAVLVRNGEIFNRVRADAARVLGMGEVDEVGLARFMGRRPIL